MNSVSDLIHGDFVTANESRILFRGENVSLFPTSLFRTGLAVSVVFFPEQFAFSSQKLQQVNTDVVIKLRSIEICHCLSSTEGLTWTYIYHEIFNGEPDN